jgi:hypothetical protein
MIKGYNEIRATCMLVDYSYKLAGNAGLWVEHYVDEQREYFALFGDKSHSHFPLTITYINLE